MRGIVRLDVCDVVIVSENGLGGGFAGEKGG